MSVDPLDSVPLWLREKTRKLLSELTEDGPTDPTSEPDPIKLEALDRALRFYPGSLHHPGRVVEAAKEFEAYLRGGS